MSKALAWMFVTITLATSPSPLATVRESVGQMVTLLQVLDRSRSPHEDVRQAALHHVTNGLFDFKEAARRMLGRHWAESAPREREAFARLLTELLERWWLGKIEQYADETIVYVSESIDGNYAVVRSKVVRARQPVVPVDYRLYRSGARWAVYDVLIDGASVVSSYRNQLDRRFQTESVASLLRRMAQAQGGVLPTRPSGL